jgi:excinuclease ABC subunit C
LLLESKLIKKFKPFYNIISKDDKSPYYIHITEEKYPKPIINHESTKAITGPFLNKFTPQKILRLFRKITPYCTANRFVKRPCIYSQIGLCFPCPAQITQQLQIEQYLLNITLLKRMLSGKIQPVLLHLEKSMRQAVKNQNFETAIQLRDKLNALKQLLNIPISPDEYYSNPNLLADVHKTSVDSLLEILKPFFPRLTDLNRIEAYDISHLKGESATAALVVSEKGALRPDKYRHFTIKIAPSDNDVEMMREVICRRFRNSWPFPQLIVLDGGVPQLSSILKPPAIFPENTALLAVSKNDEALHIFQNGYYVTIKPDLTNPGLKLLQNLRDEAHRFSRRLHHLHRRSIIYT